MRLIEMWLLNFLSYKDQQFKDLSTPGLVLLQGRNLDNPAFEANGAGKSAIWDGVAWCLFGETTRDIKAEEVIRRGETECTVGLILEHKGKTFKILRKRGGKSGGELKLNIEEGGVSKDMTQGTTLLTQKVIESELGIDIDLFKCTTVFAQGETFNFVDATDSKQKDILGKIMRLNLDRALENAKKSDKKLSDELGALQMRASELRGKIDSSRLTGMKGLIDAWDNSQKRNIEELTAALELKMKTVEEYEKELAREAEYLAVKPKLEALVSIKRRVREAKTDAMKGFEITIAECNAILRRLQQVNGVDLCPVCSKPVDRHSIENEQAQILERRADAISGHTRSKSEHEASLVELQNAEDKHLKLNQKLDDFQNLRDTTLLFTKEYVARLEVVLKNAVSLPNPHVGLYEEELKMQAEYQKMIVENEREIMKKTGEFAYSSFWTQGFGDQGIKSMVFDLVCSTLTSRANHYAGLLTGGAVSIVFSTQKKLKNGDVREKFDCEVLVDGKRVSYGAYSGGEKRRISLAVDLALSDLMVDYYGSDFSLVVYDEQDQYMDGVGRKHYLNLLREISTKKKVFVVAHDSVFKSMFEHVWTIEKKGGISKLVEVV